MQLVSPRFNIRLGTMNRSWRLGVLFFASISLGPSAVLANEPTTLAGEAIDVRVVNVEAIVTDLKGERVHGLGRQDFRLTVDGQEVAVDYLSEIGGAIAAKSEPTAPLPIEGVARNYLLYLDNVFSLASVRDEVLERLAKDLSLLGAGDRVSILSSDGERIDVLCPWTSDSKQIEAALARARKQAAGGNQMLAAQRRLYDDAEWVEMARHSIDDGDSGNQPTLNAADRMFDTIALRVSPEARTALGKVTEQLRGTLRSLEAPPGRKMLLLLSGAWAMRVESNLYAPILSVANELGYAIYPVDLGMSGVKDVSSFDVFARATGGRAVVAADLRIFPVVENDTDSYYLLGFSPKGKSDGQRHAIALSVARPGLTVRTRTEFADRSPRRVLSAYAEGVLRFGGDSSQERLYVAFGAPISRGREVEMPVTLGVPVELLLQNRAPGPQRIELPLAIANIDKNGQRSSLPSTALRVDLPASFLAKAGTLVRFETILMLRNVSQRMIFSVGGFGDGAAIWGSAEFKPDPSGNKPR